MKTIIFIALLLSILNASEAFLPESDLSLDITKADIALLGGSLPCTICDKVMGFVVSKIEKYGCSFIFKVEAAAACEAAGLGPEDPLSDICVVAMIGACSEIASLIQQKVTDPTQLCNLVHICT